MHTHLQIGLAAIVLSQALPAETINFEGIVDGVPVTNQFVGVSFTNTTVLSAGIGLNEFEFPTRSGQNVAFDDGGPISIVFGDPVLSFSAYLTYTVPITMVAFDLGNNVVGQATSLYGSNLALSGDPGSLPNELFGIASGGGISRVTITGDPFGGSFVLDDLTFTNAVPEPSYLPLFTSGVALLGALRNKFSKHI